MASAIEPVRTISSDMKRRRIREKKCKLCEQFSEVLYRVQYQQTDWSFVCLACWTTLDKANYTYGGTWKAKKRR